MRVAAAGRVIRGSDGEWTCRPRAGVRALPRRPPSPTRREERVTDRASGRGGEGRKTSATISRKVPRNLCLPPRSRGLSAPARWRANDRQFSQESSQDSPASHYCSRHSPYDLGRQLTLWPRWRTQNQSPTTGRPRPAPKWVEETLRRQERSCNGGPTRRMGASHAGPFSRSPHRKHSAPGAESSLPSRRESPRRWREWPSGPTLSRGVLPTLEACSFLRWRSTPEKDYTSKV